MSVHFSIVDVIKADSSTEECVLIVMRPQWADPVTVEHARPTGIEESELTGVEDRWPDAARTLHRLRYTALLDTETDWQAVRDAVGSLAGRRVLCPVWCDLLPAAEYDTALYPSELVLGISDDWTTFQVGTAEYWPAQDYLVPLLAGHWMDVDTEALCGTAAELEIVVEEDSPHELRVSVGVISDPSEDTGEGGSYVPDYPPPPAPGAPRLSIEY